MHIYIKQAHRKGSFPDIPMLIKGHIKHALRATKLWKLSLLCHHKQLTWQNGVLLQTLTVPWIVKEIKHKYQLFYHHIRKKLSMIISQH